MAPEDLAILIRNARGQSCRITLRFDPRHPEAAPALLGFLERKEVGIAPLEKLHPLWSARIRGMWSAVPDRRTFTIELKGSLDEPTFLGEIAQAVEFAEVAEPVSNY